MNHGDLSLVAACLLGVVIGIALHKLVTTLATKNVQPSIKEHT